jgi:hypothetical protein
MKSPQLSVSRKRDPPLSSNNLYVAIIFSRERGDIGNESGERAAHSKVVLPRGPLFVTLDPLLTRIWIRERLRQLAESRSS